MRLLLDTCVWPGAVTELAANGHGVLWAGDWPADPGDDEILAFALKESRLVLSHLHNVSLNQPLTPIRTGTNIGTRR